MGRGKIFESSKIKKRDGLYRPRGAQSRERARKLVGKKMGIRSEAS